MRPAPAPFISSLLVTEDDLVLRRFYRQALGDICQKLAVVDNPETAAEILRGGEFEFLITDLKMGGRSGLEIIEIAVAYRAGIAILVASGYVDDEKYSGRLETIPNVRGVLQKPFTADQLYEKLAAIAPKKPPLPGG